MADELREQDLRVEVYDNASPPPNYECSVRITHLPTGITTTADVPPCRSQVEAKAKCLSDLRELI